MGNSNKPKPSKRIPMNIYFMDHVKDDLQKLSDETGMAMSHLVVLATQSLISNYRSSGSDIFASLLDASHRQRPGTDLLVDTPTDYSSNK